MKIEVATAQDVEHVAWRMRPNDLREFMATSHADSHPALVADLKSRVGTGGRDDILAMFADEPAEPVAIAGTPILRPNVVSLLFFATPRFSEIGLGATRFIKQNLFPALRSAGCHRFEAASIDGNDEAHAWMRVLGLRREATARGFGRCGETFHWYSWVRDVGPTPA